MNGWMNENSHCFVKYWETVFALRPNYGGLVQTWVPLSFQVSHDIVDLLVRQLVSNSQSNLLSFWEKVETHFKMSFSGEKKNLFKHDPNFDQPWPIWHCYASRWVTLNPNFSPWWWYRRVMSPFFVSYRPERGMETRNSTARRLCQRSCCHINLSIPDRKTNCNQRKLVVNNLKVICSVWLLQLKICSSNTGWENKTSQ